MGDIESERRRRWTDDENGRRRQLALTNRGEANPWSGLEWLACSDGRARPTQPGLFPLAHGLRNRASQLRAYGNAIVPQVAAQFIEAVMEVIDNE
jgi:DNA (cytosine-5)-methyltransferase 1